MIVELAAGVLDQVIPFESLVVESAIENDYVCYVHLAVFVAVGVFTEGHLAGPVAECCL